MGRPEVTLRETKGGFRRGTEKLPLQAKLSGSSSRREANKTLKALEGIDKHKKIVLGNMIDNKRTQDIISEIIRERLFE